MRVELRKKDGSKEVVRYDGSHHQQYYNDIVDVYLSDLNSYLIHLKRLLELTSIYCCNVLENKKEMISTVAESRMISWSLASIKGRDKKTSKKPARFSPLLTSVV